MNARKDGMINISPLVSSTFVNMLNLTIIISLVGKHYITQNHAHFEVSHSLQNNESIVVLLF